MRKSFVLGTIAVAVAIAPLLGSADGEKEQKSGKRLKHLADQSHSLFSSAKAVMELSTDDLSAFSAGSEKCSWIVLYYHSDCGHCRSFAPHYASTADEKSTLGNPYLFGAINCRDFPDLCRERNVHAFPTAKAFVGGKWNDVQANVDSIKKFIQEDDFNAVTKKRCTALWQYFQEINTAKMRVAQEKRKQLAQGGTKQPFKAFTEFEQTDAANAFFSTMWHEVPMRPVEETSTEALVNFLNVVKASIPSLGAESLLRYLHQNGSPSHIGVWKDKVENAGIPIKGEPGEVVWTTCKGSSWQYRGYPCGMWLLFHSIVASSPKKKACSAIHGIQEYIKEFFVCSECREHFAGYPIPFEASEDGDDACYKKANLWLWKVHNEVNARLSKEQDDNDPEVPKVQFPSKTQCPKCFDLGLEGDGGGNYNQDAVVEFLDNRYRWDVHKVHAKPHLLDTKGKNYYQDNREIYNENAERREEAVQHNKQIERTSLGMTIFCAILVVGMIIWVMWRHIQGSKPVRQRPEYLAERAKLLRQAGNGSRYA